MLPKVHPSDDQLLYVCDMQMFDISPLYIFSALILFSNLMRVSLIEIFFFCLSIIFVIWSEGGFGYERLACRENCLIFLVITELSHLHFLLQDKQKVKSFRQLDMDHISSSDNNELKSVRTSKVYYIKNL